MESKTSPLAKLCWIYAGAFVLVVAIGYVPGVEDAEGRMFGLFVIDPIDDVVHLTSAAWAAFGAWRSRQQAVVFLRWFGLLYFLDGLSGVIFGEGFLDGAILLPGAGIPDLLTRVAANVPHLGLGGFAAFSGFVLAKKWLR